MSARAGYPRFFQLDAFQEQIMDFPPLIESDLPQRLISGLWQIDARMSITTAAGRARKSGSNLQLCLTTPRSGNSNAFSFGR
jgi:hypothetical protein